MSKHNFDDLFARMNELAVGFGPIFKDFQHTATNYPPHNIVTVSENEFILEMAVAGFKKSEITISEDKGLLTITADKAADADKQSNYYQYKGIANRSFSKSFRIAEYFEIAGAKLEDGILTVGFVKSVPEEAKPKLIAIK